MRLRFGLTLSMYPPHDLVRLGITAERYGFDSVWVPDHFVDLPPSGDRVEPWTVLSAIGAKTERVMLSTGVTDVQRNHPARTAHIVATLDELTHGRAAIGIGAGEAMNIVPFGIAWEEPKVRIERLKEYVMVMKMLWSSSRDRTVTFKGKFYELNGAWLDQSPVQKPSPPVYIGALGASKSLLRVVGEVGDGWFPWLNSPETFKSRSEVIKEAARRAGRDPSSLDLAIVLFIALTEDPDLQKRAIDALKPEIYVLVDRETLKNLGYEAPTIGYDVKHIYCHAPATNEVADKAAEAARDMPDGVAKKFMAVGGVDECIKTIEEFVKVGATHITLRDVAGQYVLGRPDETEKMVKTFGERIIKYFRDQMRA